MARDRNVYVWQAYVIVMSIVSVVCLGFLALVIFQSGTNSKTVEGALAKEKKAVEDRVQAINARQVLERIVGVGNAITEAEFQQLLTTVGADEQLNKAVKQYTTNMSLMGPGVNERNYSKLVDTLMQELRSRNQQIDAMTKRETELRDKYEATIAQETKAREAERQRAQDMAIQLEKATTTFTEKIAEQQQSITKIEADKQVLLKAHEKKNKDLALKLEKAEQSYEEQVKRTDQLARKLEQIEGEDFQYVQGRITQVSDGGQTVWVNLGKADGLRPGISFGVVDGDVSRVTDVKPKATLEVVAIVPEADHLARCKVLSDHSPTTILPGDAIYSPAWQPGGKVQFVLVGKMDLDGDGKDDTETLKALIEQNGGTVRQDINVDTRWLVMGEDFKVRTSDPEQGVKVDPAAKKRLELEQQAKALGVSRINVDKLKGWLRGSGASELSTIGAGLRSKPSDYLTNNPKGFASGNVNGLYQGTDGRPPRKPPQP